MGRHKEWGGWLLISNLSIGNLSFLYSFIRLYFFLVSEYKDKWKNLRAVFVRHMRPARSGSGSKAKKPYDLAEAMQFTLPYIKAMGVATPGNLPEITEQVQQIPDLLDDEEEGSNSHVIAFTSPSCSSTA
jgi:hypothetical protein